ncbi:MAG TPA: hypothetical protein PK079_11615 [Leptospiraceae bacterium]|nr:hypothetical protein [Leptospiraceae bacterium]HMY31568.1 hypothetical protein [Leptospiraceae bacterium]HMZ64475.1 hypothetical protein [Leptospiraceae bacterium]HNA10430.1 hypothetical protein [Leptospiraceae bacterium]HNC55419.1 hypothetical protein [Leptospiraceae bacterium]
MKIIILLLLLLSFSFCSSKTEKPIPERTIDGWAGHPDDPNKKPFEYYYMKHASTASQKSIKSKNGDLIRSTCIEANKSQAKTNLIPILIGNTIFSQSSPGGQLPIDSSLKYLHCNNDNFYFNVRIDPFNLRNIIALEIWELEKLLIKEYKKIIKVVEVKDCKPLAVPDPEIPLSKWKDCECLVYAQVPGGRDAFIVRAQKIDTD